MGHGEADLVTPGEWARIKGIVADALTQPVDRRPAYLAAQCGSDSAGRREAESLLASVVAAADLYDRPALLIAGAEVGFADAFADLAATPPVLGRAALDGDLHTAPARFHGTSRYRVVRQIGAGGMGIVYAVEDRARGQLVALKTLRRWDGADIYRLKREFRSLSDISHSNLVTLHDLVVDEEHCFFTMELIDGASMVDYVRQRGSADADRARRVLAQLIEGVAELHRRGKLHRDVKPSNVLVTPDERVVILDFGLTSDMARGAGADERGLMGTPAYLSPEQCRGLELREASDWYSVGATLYHVLTGQPPFNGDVFEVIERKAAADPVSVKVLAPDIPDDLAAVCMGLLSRDPATRLTGVAALTRLRDARRVTLADAAARSPFVGREQYLEILRNAFAAVKEGQSVPIYLHGPSGIGKSALVQRFFDQTLAAAPIVALRSRCHEHESIPYKGLDGIIDGLSRYLTALPPAEAARLLPADTAALARLFPVMQIEAVGALPRHEGEVADPAAVRRRAFVALRELLGRIAERQPLVIEIDDFHWADGDSAASVVELLRPPAAPALLLLLSFRTEEIEAKPFLRALLEQPAPGTKVVMALPPLSDREVARMIDALLPAASSARGDDHLEIAREAGGNPYLVEELARYSALGDAARRGATLQEMLKQRLLALPAGSRAFIEALAVCGRPILATRIFEACGLAGDERPLVARLRAAHFLRGSRSPDHVEMYHDRIRETFAAAVSKDAARQIHELMARILVRHGDDDPEALFEHYRGAGDNLNAAAHAAVAAARASQVLAFDRAAAFYRHALEFQPRSAERTMWTVGLARSLENAGRPAEAADAWLAAAREAEGIQRVEWLRKGAEQLLMGGHIDRGLNIIDDVLPAVGMRLVRGPRAAVGAILLRRVQLAWRGLEFEAHDESQVAKEELLRIDTCWAISTGLMLVDTPRAAAVNLQELLIALDAGEPYRIARALALEAVFSVAAGGQAARRRSTAFGERARSLADRVQHPHVRALSLMTTGITSFLQGQWRPASDLCDQALTILREQCTGVPWETTLTQNFLLGALIFRGQFKYACEVLPKLLESARERGNLYYATELTTRVSIIWLARDEPDDGERQAREAMARWSDSGFHRQHYNHFMARTQTALYRGRGPEAWKIVDQHWPIMRRNLLLHVQYNRIETAFVRARAALAMMAAGHDVRRMRSVAERDARRLTREGMAWPNSLALLVRATLADLDGNVNEAVDRLDEAVEAFDRTEMLLYAAVARRRLAALVGGERAQTLMRESDAFMTAEDIRNADAMTRLIAPGFRSSANL